MLNVGIRALGRWRQAGPVGAALASESPDSSGRSHAVMIHQPIFTILIDDRGQNAVDWEYRRNITDHSM
jgi:hypothetical protein